MNATTKARPMTHYDPKNVVGDLADRIRREIAELEALKAAGQWTESLEVQYGYAIYRRMFYGM